MAHLTWSQFVADGGWWLLIAVGIVSIPMIIVAGLSARKKLLLAWVLLLLLPCAGCQATYQIPIPTVYDQPRMDKSIDDAIVDAEYWAGTAWKEHD